jgi:hypothetical protein
MKRHRATTITLTLLIISVVSPATASAGSLLSGYGGPGAGSQAIIGSTLVNNPPSGGSGAGAGASPSTGSLQSAPTSTRTATTGSSPHGATGKRAHGNQGAPVSSNTSPVGPQPRQTALIAPQAKVESSPALGISVADLLYIALALGALVLTGVFTAKLARPLR